MQELHLQLTSGSTSQPSGPVLGQTQWGLWAPIVLTGATCPMHTSLPLLWRTLGAWEAYSPPFTYLTAPGCQSAGPRSFPCSPRWVFFFLETEMLPRRTCELWFCRIILVNIWHLCVVNAISVEQCLWFWKDKSGPACFVLNTSHHRKKFATAWGSECMKKCI